MIASLRSVIIQATNVLIDYKSKIAFPFVSLFIFFAERGA